MLAGFFDSLASEKEKCNINPYEYQVLKHPFHNEWFGIHLVSLFHNEIVIAINGFVSLITPKQISDANVVHRKMSY